MSTVNCINHQVIQSSSKSVIWSISISADDKLLTVGQTAGQDGKPTLSLIEIATGKCIAVIEKSQNTLNSVYNVLFDRKNPQLLYYTCQIGAEYIVNAYNLATQAKKTLHRTGNKNIDLKLSADNNGNVLIPDSNAKLISFGGDEIVQAIDVDLTDMIKNTTDINKAVMNLSPSGQEIAIANAEKGKVFFYSIPEKKIINEFCGSFDYLETFAYDPKYRYGLAIKSNHQLIVWDLNTSQLHIESKCEYINGVLSININPTFDLFTVGMITPFTLIFDLNLGKRFYKDDYQNGRVYDVCFTSDGKKLISAGEDGKIVIRELEIN